MRNGFLTIGVFLICWGWVGVTAEAELSAEQREWLAQHGPIRVSADPNWPPFSMGVPGNRLRGLDIDLMEEVARHAGLEIKWVVAGTWQECLQLVESGAVDVLTGTAWSQKRESVLRFTRPYLEVPLALIVRTDSPFLNLPGVRENKVAALPADYVTTEYFERRYPKVARAYTTSAEQAFLFVARGDADFTVENILVANYLILQRGFTNLKIGGVVDTVFGLRYAVRHDLEPLVEILNQSLAGVSEGRRQELLAYWVGVAGSEHLDWRRIRNVAISLVGGAMVLVAFFLYRNRLLDRELRERRRIQAELEEARQRLERLNEEKNRFMAMAAHDLKTPLTSLLMTLDLLDQVGPEERAAEIQRATQTTHYMCSLVKNLLNAHAIDEGELKVVRTQVPLAPVLQRVVGRGRTLARAKGIEIESDSHAGNWRVQGDPDALEQVLDNLLSNAVKFSPAGSRIKVQARERGEGLLRIEVTDQGPGVQEEERAQLFDRFTRSSARPTAEEGSHGLGLWIVKFLVEAMGGRVGVECGQRGGSTFYFDLPMEEYGVGRA